MNDNNLHKEIDLIQACINRMANNSFMLKGWLVTIIAAMITLSMNKQNAEVIVTAAALPLLCFWYLDAFYLRTELKYRKLYDWVLKARQKGNTDFMYCLDTKRFNNDVDSVFGVMFSQTLLPFYGILLLAWGGLFFYLLFFKGECNV
ncbi:MAG: hypothetical protein J6T12_01870 [Salinivirgaceae bacterium]|nr:hypothetical protein [Salinivirgaceae bacterium]